MARDTRFICDECGGSYAESDETLIVFRKTPKYVRSVFKGPASRFKDLFLGAEFYDACGENCAFKLLSKLLGEK